MSNKVNKFRETGMFDADDEGTVLIEDKSGELVYIETNYKREDFNSDEDYVETLWKYIHEEKGWKEEE